MEEGQIEKYIKASEVRVGQIIMIKGRPCKVISCSRSKTGKHGSSKVHLKIEENGEQTNHMVLSTTQFQLLNN